MAVVLKNFIEISGLSDNVPENSGIFTQLIVRRFLSLPGSNPGIVRINAASAGLSVTNTRVARTPEAVSPEGYVMTGRKLVIEGVLRCTLEYSAGENTQGIYTVSFSDPFCSFATLPGNFDVWTPAAVTGYIEDIYIQPLNERVITVNASIILNVDT